MQIPQTTPTADPHAHWQNVFTTKDPSKVSWYQTRPENSLVYANKVANQLLPTLPGPEPKTVNVYDVGAGASYLPDHLLNQNDQGGSAYRFAVTVLDISEAALDMTRQRIAARPKSPAIPPKFIPADITKFAPPAEANHANFWHDRAVFHFMTSKENVKGYIESMKACMSPGKSFAYMATFALDGPTKCSGLDIQQYDDEGLDRTLNEGGRWLEKVEAGKEEHTTPGGSVQKFQWVLFRDMRSSSL